jgi:hypothetical protein
MFIWTKTTTCTGKSSVKKNTILHELSVAANVNRPVHLLQPFWLSDISHQIFQQFKVDWALLYSAQQMHFLKHYIFMLKKYDGPESGVGLLFF